MFKTQANKQTEDELWKKSFIKLYAMSKTMKKFLPIFSPVEVINI